MNDSASSSKIVPLINVSYETPGIDDMLTVKESTTKSEGYSRWYATVSFLEYIPYIM